MKYKKIKKIHTIHTAAVTALSTLSTLFTVHQHGASSTILMADLSTFKQISDSNSSSFSFFEDNKSDITKFESDSQAEQNQEGNLRKQVRSYSSQRNHY